MRKSYVDDKVVSVRFNSRELELLEYVYDNRPRSRYYDSLSAYIKHLIRLEYDRLVKEKAARSLPGDCHTSRGV